MDKLFLCIFYFFYLYFLIVNIGTIAIELIMEDCLIYKAYFASLKYKGECIY